MKSVVKAYLSVSKYHTHTDVQTEHGNQTSDVLRQLLTEHLNVYTLALVAFVQVRLHVLSDKTENSEPLGSFFHALFYKFFTNLANLPVASF